MTYVVPVSANDLKTEVTNVTVFTRGFSDAELLSALNFGVGKAVRAISSVRGTLFGSWIENFSVPADTKDIDLTPYEPMIWRPVRLLTVQSGSVRGVRFRYRALNNTEYEDHELDQTGGTFPTIYYDILSGLFPGTTTTVSAQVSTTQFGVASTTPFQVGQPIALPGSGPLQPIAGTAATLPTTYWGTVTAIGVNQLTVQPPMATQPTVSTVVTPYRRYVMRIANPPKQTLTGRFFYQFRPPKLTSLNDLLDPIIAEHRDMVVQYAVSWLLRSTGDQEANMWFQQAQEMRSELMQDIDPRSDQNTEAFDSDLYGTD